MTIIETERIVIDRITLDDAAFFVELVNSPDWLHYIGDRNVSNVDDARRFLQDGFLKSYSDHKFGYYIVRTALDNVRIGICGFLQKPNLKNPDFGFALLPGYYGQGFATESCQAVLDYGINTFKFVMLDAVITPDNWRSRRLLQKLGFQPSGIIDTQTSENQRVLYRWQLAI